MTAQTENYHHHHHHHHNHDHSTYVGRRTNKVHFWKGVLLALTVLVALIVIAYVVYLTTIVE